MTRCTRCNIICVKFVSDLRQVSGFLWFPPPVKLTVTRYNWNIVESGIKHHNPNLNPQPLFGGLKLDLLTP